MKIKNRFFLFFAALILFSNCRKDPKEFLLKAKEKLKQENAAEALLLYQRAYEYSLSDELFLTDIEDYYDSFQITSTGNWMIAQSKEINIDEILLNSGKITKAIKQTKENHLKIFNLKENESSQFTLKDNFFSAYLSPEGEYLLIKNKLKNKNNNSCYFQVVHVESDNLTNIKDVEASCDSSDVITDKGEIFYYKHPSIGKYIFKESKNLYPFIKKKFSYAISKTIGKSVFDISRNQKIFFLYGLAGKYSLYELKPDEKELFFMTSSVAYPRILFMKDEDYPGVFIGGADKYRFLFYQTDKERKSAYIFSANYWDEVTFYNNKIFATLEDNLLFYHNDDKKNELSQKTPKQKDGYDEKGKKSLPFWAKNIEMDYAGNLYFLTPTGSLIHWKGNPVEKESIDIYHGGVEIDPNH